MLTKRAVTARLLKAAECVPSMKRVMFSPNAIGVRANVGGPLITRTPLA